MYPKSNKTKGVTANESSGHARQAVDVLEGIRRGIEEMKRGKGVPARAFLEQLRKEFNIPKTAKRDRS